MPPDIMLEILRKQIEEINREMAVQKERVREMTEDMKEIKEELEKVRADIIQSQRESSNRTIAAQSAILLLIIAGAITYYFTFLQH